MERRACVWEYGNKGKAGIFLSRNNRTIKYIHTGSGRLYYTYGVSVKTDATRKRDKSSSITRHWRDRRFARLVSSAEIKTQRADRDPGAIFLLMQYSWAGLRSPGVKFTSRQDIGSGEICWRTWAAPLPLLDFGTLHEISESRRTIATTESCVRRAWKSIGSLADFDNKMKRLFQTTPFLSKHRVQRGNTAERVMAKNCWLFKLHKDLNREASTLTNTGSLLPKIFLYRAVGEKVRALFSKIVKL